MEELWKEARKMTGLNVSVATMNQFTMEEKMKPTKKELKIKRRRVEMREFYDKEFDIINFFWGNKVEHSRELSVNIIADFDKRDNIVGIEIFDFLEAIKKSDKEIEEIFKKYGKKQKKKETKKITL